MAKIVIMKNTKRSRPVKKVKKQKKSNKTVSRRTNVSSLEKFSKEVTVRFFEMLLLVKLYHWKTHSYATHKATDELYSSLNDNMDKFIEILLGKMGSRINLTSTKSIRLMDMDLDAKKDLEEEVKNFKSYLVSMTEKLEMTQMTNSDLLNIRDEILGDMNKFLYLLTLK